MRTTRRTTVAWTLAAAALASLATVLALPGGSGAVTTAAPENTAEPRISGSATVGSELTASQGSWTGSPTSFAYQWVRCPRSGGLPSGADCAAIGGATTTKYVVSLSKSLSARTIAIAPAVWTSIAIHGVAKRG